MLCNNFTLLCPLNNQRSTDSLDQEGCDKIFPEKSTGIKEERPQFQIVLSLLKVGDTLMVTKLVHFARSAVDAIQIIRDQF
ncbi:recombinase family protein [Neobacillus massiliamazoniensis]|uniref:recombinase family protein n=1 Tax=Neobacillus massiliamazoniensis TaxID=1499688 RepID=UPI00159EE3D1